MITVSLCGGLGNQMFQYAYARTLPSAQLLDSCNQYGCRLQHLNTKLPYITAPEGRWISEKSLRYNPVPEVVDPCILAGFWQSEQYFQPVEKELNAEFSLRHAPSEAAQQSSDKIKATPNSVMLHIRRGDYLTWARDRHGVLPMDYYLQAAQRFVDPHFFVFSDDPSWARTMFRIPYLMTVVSHTPHEDLWLMGQCNGAIIANSSLSWWGAWLGPDKRGTVVAPQRWFARGNDDAQDIVPPRWIKV